MPEIQQIVTNLSKLRFPALAGNLGIREQQIGTFSLSGDRSAIILTLAEPIRHDIIDPGQALFNITRFLSNRDIIFPEHASRIGVEPTKTGSIGGTRIVFPLECFNAVKIASLADQVGKPPKKVHVPPEIHVTKTQSRFLGMLFSKVFSRIGHREEGFGGRARMGKSDNQRF